MYVYLENPNFYKCGVVDVFLPIRQISVKGGLYLSFFFRDNVSINQPFSF